MSGGGSKKQTVGYRYYLGAHIALCHGPVDVITEIQVDRVVTWEGIADDGMTIVIDKPNLFGGDRREGGIQGLVDFAFGAVDQTPNTYLSSKISGPLPAYRGISAVILNQVYVGNNPYLKPWKFKVTRVRTQGLVDSTGDSDNFSGYWEPTLAEIEREGEDYQPGSPIDDYVLQTINLDLEGRTLNFTVDVDDELSFPIDTGSHPLFSSNFDEYGVLSSEAIELDPCVEPVKVGIVDTFGELQIPVAPHFTGVESAFSVSAAFILKADPDADGDPITISPSNEVAPLILRNGVVEVFFDNGIPQTPANQGPGGTGFNHYLKFKRSGSVLELIIVMQGGPVAGTYTADIGTTTEFTIGTMNVPASAWSRWMCWSIVHAPEFNGYETNNNTESQVEMSVGGLRFEISYIDDAGEVQTSIWSGGGSAGNTYFGLYFVNTSAGLRFVEGVNKTDGLFKILDNVRAYVAAVFSSDDVISAREILEAFKETLDSDQPCFGCADMNPAHIIRECLTNYDWGMGYLNSDIDNASFSAAAAKLFQENFGISIVWEKEETIEDFIGEILRHIDGVLYVSKDTGKFVLKLIRAEDPVITLGEDNIQSLTDLKRQSFDEITNAVTVIYWDPETDDRSSIKVHNNALRIYQGVEINSTVQYPGITSQRTATRIAQRDLKSLSTPLVTCKIVCDRSASVLNIGDPFNLIWPDLKIFNLVMRVDEISYGDGIDNRVSITAVQDVFTTPDLPTVDDNDVSWTDPAEVEPLEADPRFVAEAPYYLSVFDFGQSTIDSVLTDDPYAGFIVVAAGRQNQEINGTVFVDTGSGYLFSSDVIDFAASATLEFSVDKTDTEFFISNLKDGERIEENTLAKIGDELIRFDSLETDSSGATYISVGRGVLDTVPAEHGPSEPILFVGDFYGSDEVQYVEGEEVGVKIVTNFGQAISNINDVSEDRIEFNSRAVRPYPPGDFKIDGESYPNSKFYTGSHTLTWVHRNRRQQTTTQLYDHFDGSIGPEPGTSYIVRAIASVPDSSESSGQSREIFFEKNVGSVTSYSFVEQDSNFDSSNQRLPDDAETVTIEVSSIRGGFESWQSPSVTLDVLDSIGDSNFDSIGDSNFDSIGDSNFDSIGDSNIDSIGDSNFDSIGDSNFDSVGDSNIEIDSAGTPEADPHWSDVILLVNMNTTSDQSTHGHTVSLIGDAALTSSKAIHAQRSLQLDGSGDALQVNKSDIPIESGRFTIEMWFNVNNLTNAQGLVGSRDGSFGYFMYVQTDGAVRFNARIGSYISPILLSSTGLIVPGEWHFVVLSRDNNGFMLWVDELFVGRSNISGSISNFDSKVTFGATDSLISTAMDGYLGPIRVTDNVARYPTGSNIVVPDREFAEF